MTGYDDAFAPVVGKRVVEGQPGSFDARKRVEPLFELAIQRFQFGKRVTRGRTVQVHHHASGTWNPRFCCSSLLRLRPSMVAPATRTTDKVACTMSSALRVN